MKYLIKDTTSIERIRLVKQWEEDLSYEDSGIDLIEFYQDYIDGKKELSEVHADFQAHYVTSAPEDPRQQPHCGMGRRR